MARMSRKLGHFLKKAEHWLTAQVSLAALSLLRRLPADKALGFAEKVARTIGPRVSRHKLAVDNLRRAYPEKSPAEIEEIALDMWGNMARLAVEYVFIDKLFDFDPERPDEGRVEVDGIETFLRIREEQRPHIFFTGHIGNFEFLPVAAATFGLDVHVLFRAPNNPYIADYINETRKSVMGGLVPSRAGAALQLARILDDGGNVGALVDQKFRNGVRTTFFGRECLTSPLIPKLTRQYECDVYPAHCIRLPGGRYKLEIGDKLVLPRDENGSVDVPRMAQQLNDITEQWVRKNPGQWMWFHRRWG
ncbi:lauroyl acyltransferase [Nitratireductor aestuarii]|uniref:Lauroyl acyltransferase n=1 Tax=Nitratireductor aestuarii TaxID=1735103 RepID=A0A916VXL2_9HYPH|nr:lipid A biosynthesis lauroyl acyltransferase [Nitratireductor aestuarii]GGA51159.1 lauroyl acyltransferase [Nitratireductor aestuarii]